MGSLVALEQIQTDSQLLGEGALAVGPFARLEAEAVAAHDGKTRGAITNLFGSQAAFQAAAMALALDAKEWVERIEFPTPQDFSHAEDWLDALLARESTRGPAHGAKPAAEHGLVWALWLCAVPYGIWSDEIAKPSVAEYVQTVRKVEQAILGAFDHFELTVQPGTSINVIACAIVSLTEGVWLNQCLSRRHPCDKSEPVVTMLRRGGRMLWRGAVMPRKPAK
jgi:hypothetical protein